MKNRPSSIMLTVCLIASPSAKARREAIMAARDTTRREMLREIQEARP